MINIESLSKSYGSKQVLKDISLSLGEGKIYGIVGENGAGKTTLFRSIAGMEQFSGKIDSNFNPLKNYIGFLQTNPIFLSKITAWEYLKLLCTARGIQDDDFETQNIFDLPLNQYAETYSTGMKKKLALLGILLQKNEVFILDEPFNGVDIQSNMIISAIIQQLKEKGKTVLISSHIFSTLSDNCDQIFLLKFGQIDRTVDRTAFEQLDEEMKQFVVGDRLEQLRLD
ncbi:MAG: ABC transporter ATP-binding protein [Bacteroidota bacterium]